MQTQTIETGPNTGIAAYNEFRAQLVKIKEANEQTHFDYATPEGNKAAKSHIYKLKLSKGELEKARKEEKAASLEYGRKVDAEAKEIAAAIDEMIDVHQKPLYKIEQEERGRVGVIKNKLELIRSLGLYQQTEGSVALRERLNSLDGIIVDESFKEFRGEAKLIMAAGISAVEQALNLAIEREEAKAELERLRAENAAHAAREKEEQIKKEAAATATREAEQKAEREKAEIERRTREEAEAVARDAAKREEVLKLTAEKAEREKAEAEQREKTAQADAARRAEEADKKATEDAKRIADEKHRADIHGAIVAQFGIIEIDAIKALDIIRRINDGNIPHIKIIY